MNKQVHEIPIASEPSALRSRLRSEPSDAFPPLKPPAAPTPYQTAPPPTSPVAPSPQFAVPASEPTAVSAGGTQASMQESMTPPAPNPGAPLPPMAPPQMPAQMHASAQQFAAPSLPTMASPAAPVQPQAAQVPNLAQQPVPVPAAPAPQAPQMAAPPAPSVAPPADSVVVNSAPLGLLPPMAPPMPETLEKDIDPLGRVETGFVVHEGADPDLILALQEVVRLSASDLHVTSNAPPMLRIDGALQPVPGAEVWDRNRVTRALETLLTEAQAETFAKNLELDFAFAVSENARFRVNYYRQRDAIGGAFRLIPTEIKPLEQLGVPDTVARFAELARGLVLVTGPTGSGKSTTLAALVDLVNRTRTDHIVTVEDPIEFMHGNKRSLINQREVGSDTHSFGAALKHVLRQDPDVILIGELRDLETISVALTAAETGHLVFATLHTQSAAATIDRVIDVFPPHQQEQVRAQLASTLQGVVCQTLVKMASGKGRVVATEVMVTTPAIANLIREGKTYQIATALQAGRELGMFSMDQHLAELVDRGKITHAAAMEKAHDLEGLKRLIHRVDSGGGSASTQMANAALEFDDNFARKAH